jgi:hypothetical protein
MAEDRFDALIRLLTLSQVLSETAATAADVHDYDGNGCACLVFEHLSCP